MREMFPDAPLFSSSQSDSRPVCEWIVPNVMSKRDYARTCKALPPGMPDSLEVRVTRLEEGTERSTAVIYGARAYLIHYEFKPVADSR